MRGIEFKLCLKILRIPIGKPQTYFSNVTFYLDKDREELNEVFNRIDITTNIEQKSIKLVGFNETTEREIFEMNFDKINVMEHIYLCILRTIDSRAKIKTLRQILEKTTIPIIRPFPQVANEKIITKIKEVFDPSHKDIPNSPIELDNEIEKKEAEIDANVFKLYNFNRDEIVLIMNRLPITSKYEERVLHYFNLSSLKN